MSNVTMLCSKKVPGPCAGPAVEILYARELGSQQEEMFPRCADHPAAHDEAMIRLVSPHALTRIEPVRA